MCHARESKGLTIVQLSAQTGIPFLILKKMECGYMLSIPNTTMQALRSVLHLSDRHATDPNLMPIKTLDGYQIEARKFSGQKDKPQFDRERLMMVGLGLWEAGEAAGLIKKHCFHGHDFDREKFVKELGDLLWYLSEGADCVGMSLSEIAELNIQKLTTRYGDKFSVERSINRTE
jgi:NTP pyrophosphatase (non-canonical NTP hydrolase)